jgi:purine-nucleoside phosphorylase
MPWQGKCAMRKDPLAASDAIKEAAHYVQSKWARAPQVGIILGSGLGGLAEAVEDPTAVSYEEIPHFPRSTAIGHQGRFVCGQLGGVNAVVMQGRLHLYEGHPVNQITLPVQVMCLLGIQTLIVSNAAGGLNPHFSAGDVMVLSGHLNRMNRRPQEGLPAEPAGVWMQSTLRPYDPQLNRLARSIARQHDFEAPLGIYAGHLGPNYETRAEYRYLRRMGADAVGMSTIPEVLIAEAHGVRTLALSAITNVCCPDALSQTTAEEVLQTASVAGEKMGKILLGVLHSHP